MKKQQHLLHHVFLITSSLIFLYYVLKWFNYFEDDAFITMRYAMNMLHGHGWVLNPGEHVEGYTSPMHVWYLTILMSFLSIDNTIIVSKFLGIVLGISVLWQTRSLARLVFPKSQWIGDVAMVMLALRPEYALAMTNGLETGMAVWFYITGLLFFLNDIRNNQSRIATAVLFLCAALSRPEFTLSFPILLLLYRKQIHTPLNWLTYVTGLGCLLIFRLAYYHDIVPNTYWAKHTSLGNAAGSGIIYLISHIFLKFEIPTQPAMPYGPPFMSPFAPLLSLFVFILGSVAMIKHGQFRKAFGIVILIQIIFMLMCGGDWMPEGRFAIPILPLLMISYAAAGWTVLRRILSHKGSETVFVKGWSLTVVVACLAALYYSDSLPRMNHIALQDGLRNIVVTLRPHPPLIRWMCAAPNGRYKMGEWVAQHAKAGEYVATTEIGIVSVMNPNVNFIDLRALCDRSIAHMQSYNHSNIGVVVDDIFNPAKEAYAYLNKRRPQWYMVFQNEDFDNDDNSQYKKLDDFEINGDMPGPPWRIQNWELNDRDKR